MENQIHVALVISLPPFDLHAECIERYSNTDSVSE